MEPVGHSAHAGVPFSTGPFDLVVVGASLGGPPVIERLLAALPRDFALPVAVCQHIAQGMSAPFAERLDSVVGRPVIHAYDRAPVEPGCVYIAASGRHLRIERKDGALRLRLVADTGGGHHVPSVDELFASAAVASGTRAVAVILTGLGDDGAAGMRAVRNAGGYTIAQDAAECTASNMPDAAERAGAVVERLPIDGITARLAALSASAR